MNKNTTISVEGVEFVVPDHWFWPEFKSSGWEPGTFNIFKNNINKQTTYIDIGAWIGVTAIYAYMAGCRNIHAVEANPESFKILSNITKWNNTLTTIVNLKNICITDTDNSTVKFGKHTSSASQITSTGQYVVTTQRLDSYIKEIECEDHDLFIKIDIEGSELLLLDCLSGILNAKNKVLLSLHPPFWKDVVGGSNDIISTLSKFKLYTVAGEPLSVTTLKSMMTSKEKYPKWGTKFGNFFEIFIKS